MWTFNDLLNKMNELSDKLKYRMKSEHGPTADVRFKVDYNTESVYFNLYCGSLSDLYKVHLVDDRPVFTIILR